MKIEIDTKQLNAALNDALDQGMHALDQGIRRFEEVRDTLSNSLKEQTGDLQANAKKHWKTGSTKVLEAEKAVETHVRQNPALYLAVGVGLVAVLLAKITLNRRRLTGPRK